MHVGGYLTATWYGCNRRTCRLTAAAPHAPINSATKASQNTRSQENHPIGTRAAPVPGKMSWIIVYIWRRLWSFAVPREATTLVAVRLHHTLQVIATELPRCNAQRAQSEGFNKSYHEVRLTRRIEVMLMRSCETGSDVMMLSLGGRQRRQPQPHHNTLSSTLTVAAALQSRLFLPSRLVHQQIC